MKNEKATAKAMALSAKADWVGYRRTLRPAARMQSLILEH